MEASEIKTLKTALEILRKRLTNNVSEIKRGTKSGSEYIYTEETFQENKKLLKENQANLMLQKHFSEFLTNYMFNLSFSDQVDAEDETAQVAEKTQEDYFLEVIEGRKSLEENIEKIDDTEILNNLLQYFLDDEQYENCTLVQEQINKTEKVS